MVALASNICVVFVLCGLHPVLDDCSKEELEEMVLQQMAFENIFVAENLSVPDEDFQREYDEVKREFGESQSQYDDARLQEQVLESLKVRFCNSQRHIVQTDVECAPCITLFPVVLLLLRLLQRCFIVSPSNWPQDGSSSAPQEPLRIALCLNFGWVESFTLRHDLA